ncbi:hypothetical protein LCM4579_13410 [Ensifer sp. LCM 4579]|nr:hypothetical protein LCM4579_13410 [Ensifer sp. LCM 4579]
MHSLAWNAIGRAQIERYPIRNHRFMSQAQVFWRIAGAGGRCNLFIEVSQNCHQLADRAIVNAAMRAALLSSNWGE